MFTTPCFIRKNTLELRKKLEELGYAQVKQAIYYNHIMVENGNIWLCEEAFNPQKPNGEGWKDCVDCGTNEELFLAIAALRDDTDEDQWFVYNNTWFKCEYESIEDKRARGYDDPYYGAWLYDSHKATIEELIEHFGGDINVGSK